MDYKDFIVNLCQENPDASSTTQHYVITKKKQTDTGSHK